MTSISETFSSKLEKGNESDEINNFGLPKAYNETKIVILPKDPVCIYSYWEIAGYTVETISKQYGEVFDVSYIALRVYDITDTEFDGTNSNGYFDIKVNTDSLSWYISVGEHNRSWCVDIGYVLKTGEYIAVARSNALVMPRYGVSDISDNQWTLLKLKFEKLLKMSDSGQCGKSSYDTSQFMKARFEEILKLSSSKIFGSSNLSFKSGQSLVKDKQTLK